MFKKRTADCLHDDELEWLEEKLAKNKRLKQTTLIDNAIKLSQIKDEKKEIKREIKLKRKRHDDFCERRIKQNVSAAPSWGSEMDTEPQQSVLPITFQDSARTARAEAAEKRMRDAQRDRREMENLADMMQQTRLKGGRCRWSR